MKMTDNPKYQAFENQLQIVNDQLSRLQKEFGEKMLTLDNKYRKSQAANATLKETLNKEREQKNELQDQLHKLRTEFEGLKTRMQRDVNARNSQVRDKQITTLEQQLNGEKTKNMVLSMMCGGKIEDSSLLTKEMCQQREWNIDDSVLSSAIVFRVDHESYSFRFALCDSTDPEFAIAFLPMQLTRKTGKFSEILEKIPSNAPEYLQYRVDVTQNKLKYLIASLNLWFSEFVDKLTLSR